MEDQNAPATKADIRAVKADIAAVKADVTAVKADMTAVKADMTAVKADMTAVKADMAEVKQDIEQLRSEVNHGYNDLVERMADSETRLLKAFYDFAQSNHQRVTLLEGNEAGIRSRLATLEDRLLQVEKRLNMPPAA